MNVDSSVEELGVSLSAWTPISLETEIRTWVVSSLENTRIENTSVLRSWLGEPRPGKPLFLMFWGNTC